MGGVRGSFFYGWLLLVFLSEPRRRIVSITREATIIDEARKYFFLCVEVSGTFELAATANRFDS